MRRAAPGSSPLPRGSPRAAQHRLPAPRGPARPGPPRGRRIASLGRPCGATRARRPREGRERSGEAGAWRRRLAPGGSRLRGEGRGGPSPAEPSRAERSGGHKAAAPPRASARPGRGRLPPALPVAGRRREVSKGAGETRESGGCGDRGPAGPRWRGTSGGAPAGAGRRGAAAAVGKPPSRKRAAGAGGPGEARAAEQAGAVAVPGAGWPRRPLVPRGAGKHRRLPRRDAGEEPGCSRCSPPSPGCLLPAAAAAAKGRPGRGPSPRGGSGGRPPGPAQPGLAVRRSATGLCAGGSGPLPACLPACLAGGTPLPAFACLAGDPHCPLPAVPSGQPPSCCSSLLCN